MRPLATESRASMPHCEVKRRAGGGGAHNRDQRPGMRATRKTKITATETRDIALGRMLRETLAKHFSWFCSERRECVDAEHSPARRC